VIITCNWTKNGIRGLRGEFVAAVAVAVVARLFAPFVPVFWKDGSRGTIESRSRVPLLQFVDRDRVDWVRGVS
jgi:hypothetical protein